MGSSCDGLSDPNPRPWVPHVGIQASFWKPWKIMAPKSGITKKYYNNGFLFWNPNDISESHIPPRPNEEKEKPQTSRFQRWLETMDGSLELSWAVRNVSDHWRWGGKGVVLPAPLAIENRHEIPPFLPRNDTLDLGWICCHCSWTSYWSHSTGNPILHRVHDPKVQRPTSWLFAAIL